MGRECLGICGRYETTYNRGAYARGFKHCSRCYLFIKVSENVCPCCKTPLRGKSHQSKRLIPVTIQNSNVSETKVKHY